MTPAPVVRGSGRSGRLAHTLGNLTQDPLTNLRLPLAGLPGDHKDRTPIGTPKAAQAAARRRRQLDARNSSVVVTPARPRAKARPRGK